MPAPPWQRYRDLVDDWTAFEEALLAPQPPCLWLHPERVPTADAERVLARELGPLRPVAWRDRAYRLEERAQPGRSWMFRTGWFQIQEEASLVPVEVLDPQPGERVLDLCAAPGNKTAQIALRVGGRGTVVANDRSRGRLTAARDAIARLGLFNVVLTGRDGCDYPESTGPFDRVLVDAPCSAEGTVHKNPQAGRDFDGEYRRWVSGVQRALLRRAATLVRPGGVVVYSTCTLAPEENEAVVEAVLRERQGELEIEPARVEGLEASPGLSTWQGRAFEAATGDMLRLWPHRAQTGAFFVARLRRVAGPEREEPRPLEGDPVDLGQVLELFGLPEDALSGLVACPTRRRLRAAARGLTPPAGVEPVTLGFPLARGDSAWPKLSTATAFELGHRATRRQVELDRDQLAEFLCRRPVSWPGLGKGPVLATHRGRGVGFGLGGGDRLESQFPKAWGQGEVSPPYRRD